MKIKPPRNKKLTVIKLIKKFKKSRTFKIRDFASLIGKLVSYCQTFKYRWAYLKDLERDKCYALGLNHKNSEAAMVISTNTQEDFTRWKNNVTTAFNSVTMKKFCMESSSDASLTGWGACVDANKTHGHWSETERKNYSNYLELLERL